MHLIIYALIIIFGGFILFLLFAYGGRSRAARIAAPIAATLLATFVGTVFFADSGIAHITGPVFAVCTMGGFILHKLDK